MERLKPTLFTALLAMGVVVMCSAQVTPPGMARIPDGVFHPLFSTGAGGKEIPVKAFYLDILPVTTGEFLEFVRANPRWQRSQVKGIFADDAYLKNWKGDLEPGTNILAESPVTFVSWFAANAYAGWKVKRLPTVAEWEYAAAASPKSRDGTNDAAFTRRVFAWYNSPSPAQLAAVGSGERNYWGIHDLHGLVWEWVADFNAAMVTGDARGDTGPDSRLFCGAGAVGATDVGNFAAFMRYGFRSSLKADYCVHNLGFRCASDLDTDVKASRKACCVKPLEATPFSSKSLYLTAAEWTNDAGAEMKLSQLSGKPQVVVMFFAQCQAACPILVNDMKRIEAALPSSLRGRVGFTLVSFDAKRDTPLALNEYRKLRDMDGRWTLLSGSPNAIMELAALLGVRYQPTAGGGFMHSNLITVLDSKGEIVFQQSGLSQDTEPLVKALQQLNTL